jgi:adenylosuccinate lyase
VILSMRSEQAELCEGFKAGVVGSSTMPQKVNPKDSQDLIHIGRRLAHNAANHLTHPAAWESGDRAVRSVIYESITTSCQLCRELMPLLQRLLNRLIVRPEIMRRNLTNGGLWLMSERVMLALGERYGRQAAHDRMHALTALASECTLPEALEREMGDDLDAEAIAALCDPSSYLGSTDALIDATRAAATEVITTLNTEAERQINVPHPVLSQRLRLFIDA